MPADVLEVTKKFMREPVRILVKKEELTLEGIRQFYINVEKEVEKHFPVAMVFSQQTRQMRQMVVKLNLVVSLEDKVCGAIKLSII